VFKVWLIKKKYGNSANVGKMIVGCVYYVCGKTGFWLYFVFLQSLPPFLFIYLLCIRIKKIDILTYHIQKERKEKETGKYLKRQDVPHSGQMNPLLSRIAQSSFIVLCI
jgi:hypothetical protein